MNLQFFAEDDEQDTPDNLETSAEELNVEELNEEQLAAIKEKFGFKDDNDVDSIIKGRKAKWQKEQEAKQKEADRLATMNEDEKAEHEKQKLLDRIAELEQKDNFTAMSKEASKMLADASISPNEELLAIVVKDTAEGTQEAVNALIAIVDKKAEEKTKEALSGKPPKVNLTPGKQMTRDEIMKISNPTKRQQAIKDNLHLFKK